MDKVTILIYSRTDQRRFSVGVVQFFTPEKLVIAMLVSDLELLEPVKLEITSRWGEIDSWMEPEEFTFTDYYQAEMGSPLYRVFCSLEPLINPEDLAVIKIMTNEVESMFLRNEGRVVNLDPGILCQSKFILATTKNNAHRIPMSQGIYGELTLQYRNRQFRDLEWTYPDYRGESTRNYLLQVRKIYVSQLKSLQKS